MVEYLVLLTAESEAPQYSVLRAPCHPQAAAGVLKS